MSRLRKPKGGPSQRRDEIWTPTRFGPVLNALGLPENDRWVMPLGLKAQHTTKVRATIHPGKTPKFRPMK